MFFGRDRLKKYLEENDTESLTITLDGKTFTFSLVDGMVKLQEGENYTYVVDKYPYTFSSMGQFLDFVYNVANFDKFFFANGTPKKKALEEFSWRCGNKHEWPFTSYMINAFAERGVDVKFHGHGYVSGNTITPLNTTIYFHVYHAKHISVNGTRYAVPSDFRFSEAYNVTLHNESNSYWTSDTEFINGHPKEWFMTHYTQCTECGEYFPNNQVFDGICQNCSGIDISNIVIREYRERATNFFDFKIGKYNKSLYKEPLFYGIELEYEATDMEAGLNEAGQLLSTHAIFKRDGSLNSGFEIVTRPATFDIQQEVMQKFFEKFPRHLKPASTCGMHVHISRKPLSYLTQGKIVEFMNREENKPYLKKLAGRWSDSYANNDTSRTVTYPWNVREGARYNVVNTNNRETLEFRLFASPKKWEDFIMRLEFCDAITAYSSPCQSKANKLSDITQWEWFAQYVADNRKSFPNLFKFIA